MTRKKSQSCAIILSVEHLFHSARWKIIINISWVCWHIYNFVVCKYNDNKQSESESESESTLTADDFLHSSLIKLKLSLHNFPHHNLSSTSYQQTYTHSHPSLHSLRQKSPNSFFIFILLLVRLILFHLISFKPFLLRLYLHSLTSVTSLYTGVFSSAFRQAHITPQLKKPPLTHPFYKTTERFPLFLSMQKTFEQAIFNQVSAFLTQNNLLDSNQSGFRSRYSTKTALLSAVEALRQAREDSKSSILILLLLTRLTTRSSCQPYCLRASQEPHSSDLSLSSQTGPARYLGEVSCPSYKIELLGCLRAQFLHHFYSLSTWHH